MTRQRAVREGKALGRLGWNYLFCIQVQFFNNRDKTRVLADTVISCMLVLLYDCFAEFFKLIK